MLSKDRAEVKAKRRKRGDSTENPLGSNPGFWGGKTEPLVKDDVGDCSSDGSIASVTQAIVGSNP